MYDGDIFTRPRILSELTPPFLLQMRLQHSESLHHAADGKEERETEREKTDREKKTDRRRQREDREKTDRDQSIV